MFLKIIAVLRDRIYQIRLVLPNHSVTRWLFAFVCYLVDVIFFVVPVVYCAHMFSIQKTESMTLNGPMKYKRTQENGNINITKNSVNLVSKTQLQI